MKEFFTQVIFDKWGLTITVGNLVVILGAIALLIVLDILINRAIFRSKWVKQIISDHTVRKMIRRTVRWGLYGIGLILAFRFVGYDLLGEALYTLDEGDGQKVRVIHIIGVLVTILLTRFIVWYAHRLLVQRPTALKKVDQGRRLALFQII